MSFVYKCFTGGVHIPGAIISSTPKSFIFYYNSTYKSSILFYIKFEFSLNDNNIPYKNIPSLVPCFSLATFLSKN